MDNLYDIRNEKLLMYILPKLYSKERLDHRVLKQTAVVINLYYMESVEFYLGYIKKIPNEIQVYIISSVQEIIEKIKESYGTPPNITFLEKKNRGRDISALLVVFREIAKKYKYFCYLHDKKAKQKHLKEDVDLWIENLWDNMIGSEQYIYNVLYKLENDDSIGLLVPPEPMGEYTGIWFHNLWMDNFDNTKKLAEYLELKCNLDIEKPPITIGTVFWARTNALEKLLSKKWKYEDFPEEPLANDGTINHAVERILGYVVQDAGYDTYTVMTDSYATKMLLYQYDCVRISCQYLEHKVGINTIHQLRNIDKQHEIIFDFISYNQHFYLYGAGLYGRQLLKLIRGWGFEPDGFIVTGGCGDMDIIDGIPVFHLSQIINTDTNSGIIISVNYNLQNELEAELKKHGYSNYIMGYV